MSYSPWIIENTPHGEQEYDIWARLLKDRIIFVGTPLNAHIANLIVAQLLYLEAEDADKDIVMYINSPGGDVTAGLAIYDALQYVRCEIQTLCIGQAASVSTLLLAGGQKGKRYGLPNMRAVLEQPFGGRGGTASDIQITADEVLRQRGMIIEILEKHTNRDAKQFAKDIDRDFFLSAEEAIEYGIIDQIVENKEALSP